MKAFFASQFECQERNGKITVQDFIDFETDMAAGVDLDDITYEKMFRTCWAKVLC